jgi:hypothetical protein
VLSLGWARGLRHYQSIALLGVTHASRGNSASKFQGLEVLSFKTPYKQHPRRSTIGDVIAKSMPSARFPTAAPTRARISFSWFTSDVVLQETRLITSRLLREFLRGDLQAKVVPETDYLLHFWRSHTWVPQASQQADSALTHRQEQKPKDPRRTRWPQEKGRGPISPDSRTSHPLHSMQLGTTAIEVWCSLGLTSRSMPYGKGSIEKPGCEGFQSKEGPHYQLEWSVRNQLDCNQVQRALEKLSGSYLLTSNNQPISLVRTSLCNSSPGLYCIDFAEAYVTQENVSMRIFTRIRYDTRSFNGSLHEKPSQGKTEREKNAGTNPGARFPWASYFEKTRNVCQKHEGACTTWYPEYKMYAKGIRNRSPAQPRKVQRN